MIQELPFDTPGLMDALQDAEAIEVIRQLQVRKAPATVRTLARLASMPAAVVQAKLDQLGGVGIVTALRASRAFREWRYRLTAPETCIRVDLRDPKAWKRLDAYMRHDRERIQREIEACRITTAPPAPSLQFAMTYIPALTAEEQRELRARIRRVETYVSALEKRGREALAKSGAGPTSPEKSRLHAVTVQVQPLHSPPPPQPSIHFLALSTPNDRSAPRVKDRDTLSPRESEIARLLAEGLSRPQIAKALELSLHTVCTLSTRIYRKLGVRTRAHLARVIAVD